jgi:hypothetical protein
MLAYDGGTYETFPIVLVVYFGLSLGSFGDDFRREFQFVPKPPSAVKQLAVDSS